MDIRDISPSFGSNRERVGGKGGHPSGREGGSSIGPFFCAAQEMNGSHDLWHLLLLGPLGNMGSNNRSLLSFLAGPLSDFEENPAANSPNSAAAAASSSSSSARSKRKSDYLTAYACEGSRLNITCAGDRRYLDVIRANYGRFSIAICNDHGNTDWSVNCMSPRTLRVIKARYAVALSRSKPFGSCLGT